MPWKPVLCLAALMLVSGLVGGLIGRRFARTEFERRSDPQHWNETAMRNLERRLNPTAGQHQKIQGYLDAAVEELTGVREDTARRSAAIIERLLEQVDKELTPEQQAAFAEMKPKPGTLANLNWLNVKRRKEKP
jgi:hypothetical protein